MCHAGCISFYHITPINIIFSPFILYISLSLKKQSESTFVSCVSVALNEHFVDDLKVDGLADGEVAEEESSTQKLYKKILAEQEKERKKAEARKAFDEATKPKPRAKSKTPQPEPAPAAEAEAGAEAPPVNPDGTPGGDQVPTEFRAPTEEEAANMSETVTVAYPQPGESYKILTTET